MDGTASRIRSILSLHGILFGEGVVDRDGALVGRVGSLVAGLDGSPSPDDVRGIRSIVSLYGIIFGDSELERDAGVLAEVRSLLSGRDSSGLSPYPGWHLDAGGRPVRRGTEYGIPLSAGAFNPALFGARDRLCFYRSEPSGYSVFTLAAASAARVDSFDRDRKLITLSATECTLVFEPATYLYKHVEPYLREGEQAVPYRFEDLEEFRTRAFCRLYIPRVQAAYFPLTIVLGGDEATGVSLFRAEPRMARTVSLFLLRYLNLCAGLTMADLKRPLARFVRSL